MLLTKQQILDAQDFSVEKVDVPEWGGFVFVRVISAGERDQFEKRFTKDRHSDIRAYLTSATACDDKGVLLFEKSDIEALTKKSSAAVERIFDAALRLNKLRQVDVDELVKNSRASLSAGSSSDCLS